jgi:hypothetical protein
MPRMSYTGKQEVFMYDVYQYVISCYVRKLKRKVWDTFPDATVPNRKHIHTTANKLRQIMGRKDRPNQNGP